MKWNESAFWRKLNHHAKQAGRRVVYVALLLYYVLTAPDTPMWAKAECIGALLYFILPFDAIPDFIPGIGYSDDLGVLLLAIATVAKYVTDDMKAKARSKCDEWFGSETPSIAGVWKGSIADADGFGWQSDLIVMEVTTEFGHVTGTVGPSVSDKVEFADGKLEEINLRFTLQSTTGNSRFNLLIEGDEMDGYASHYRPQGEPSQHKVHLCRAS